MAQSNTSKNRWRSRAQERINLNNQLHEVWMLLDDIEAGTLNVEEAHERFKKIEANEVAYPRLNHLKSGKCE